MHRPNIRHSSPGGMGPRPGGFRSPTADNNNNGGGGGGTFSSPPSPWGFRGGRSPSFAPRYGQFLGAVSPNSPGYFGDNGNNRGYGGGNGGKYYSNRSPMHTPRRQTAPNPRGAPPYRHSPYHSPAQHGQGYQGSPRSSPSGRARGDNGVEKYYNPSMLQDPWASLQPVAVTPNRGSSQQTTATGRQARYF